METIRLTTTIAENGTLEISGLPPGPAEVLVVISPLASRSEQPLRWRDLKGLGKEIWKGVDAQEYVSRLRDEWEE
ncbi:hypothetical protein L6Q96_05690 [Candidatus Binatia bacterium]|nr:hypothetical protein [Candidatus Binatia bacterium]